MESSKNKQVKKICIICGKEFIGHFNAKVCSEKCRLEKNKLSGRRFRNNVKEKKFINSIKDYDKERIKSLEFLGYKVLIIWEYDYIHNTNNIINNVREFILS